MNTLEHSVFPHSFVALPHSHLCKYINSSDMRVCVCVTEPDRSVRHNIKDSDPIFHLIGGIS